MGGKKTKKSEPNGNVVQIECAVFFFREYNLDLLFSSPHLEAALF